MSSFFFFFFFNDTATTEIYTLSLHDALPIFYFTPLVGVLFTFPSRYWKGRSEEHTSELQSHHDLVCRLLLEKKKKHHVSHVHDQDKEAILEHKLSAL